jgi:hypothetical protein
MVPNRLIENASIIDDLAINLPIAIVWAEQLEHLLRDEKKSLLSGN